MFWPLTAGVSGSALWPSTQDCFCVARGLGLFGILSRVGRIPLVLMSRILVEECMGGRQSNADKLFCLVL